MPNVKIKKLSIREFRNIENADMEFGGLDCHIIGENHVGKTNTLEAIAFLLTDKLLNGSTDQVTSIRPKRQADLKPEEKTPTIVEATFSIDKDGAETELTLRKQYREKWVKERGTSEVSFKGYEKILEINGVKQTTEKEYLKNVREIFGLIPDDADKIEYARLLTVPTYLGDMGEGKDWTYLRSFIIKLVGDVSDADVFSANPNLKPIQQDLASALGKVDQLKKKYKQERDGLELTIAGDDSAIEMLSATKKPADADVLMAKEHIERIDGEIANLRSNVGIDLVSDEISKQLSEKRQELLKAKDAHIAQITNSPENARKAENNAKIQEERKAISEATQSKSAKTGEKSSHEWSIRHLEADLPNFSESVNEKLVEQIRSIEEQENAEFEAVCPVCGQPLPADKAEEAKSKRNEGLSLRKRNLIDECRKNKRLREEHKQEIIAHKEAIAKLDDEIASLDAVINTSLFKISELEKQVFGTETSNVYEPNAEERRLSDEIRVLEQRLDESRKAFQNGVSDRNTAIYAKQEERRTYQTILDDLAYYNRQMETLEAKKADKGNHQKALLTVEQKREMLNQFTYIKLRMLDENVAKVFGKIRFKLISENINGGFDPICKPYIYDSERDESKDVPWFAGSKSEKIETGIAIAEAVKSKLGLPHLPYLFDEGGEISTETMKNRLKTDAQIICVKVVDDIMQPTVVPIR